MNSILQKISGRYCQSFEQKLETGIDIARCPDITHEVEEMILFGRIDGRF